MPVDIQHLDREMHRIVTTVIIYNTEKKFLVVKRAPHKKVHPNKWSVPGGGLTIDDYINLPTPYEGQWYNSVEKGLQREIKEEVAVAIGEPKYLLNITFIRPDKVPVLVLSYYAPYVSGDVKLDEDAVESRWVTLEEAKNLDFIEGIYDELEMVSKVI